MNSPEFEKFEKALKQVLTVSHKELVAREKQWKKEKGRKRKKPKK